MEKQTQEQLFNLLYSLEEFFDYDETEFGREIGELVNKLQKQLLKN